MAENKARQTVTETVHELDGQKVLVIKHGDRIVGVQTAAVVAKRIENLGTIVVAFEKGLATPDSEHLATAVKRMDERIASLTTRRDALDAETVGAAAKAQLTAKRLALVTQTNTLSAALDEMGVAPEPAPEPATEPAPAPE